MMQQINFDVIRYLNIVKILQGTLCSQKCLEFTVTLSFSTYSTENLEMFFFSFLQSKMCMPKKSLPSSRRLVKLFQRTSAPDGIGRTIFPELEQKFFSTFGKFMKLFLQFYALRYPNIYRRGINCPVLSLSRPSWKNSHMNVGEKFRLCLLVSS